MANLMRLLGAAALVTIGLLLLTGCGGARFGDDDVAGPRIFVASEEYAARAAGAGAARTAAVTSAVAALRDETASGWVGRQDDVTGYLAELSGGRFASAGDAADVVVAFFDDWGPELFGVDASALDVGPPSDAGSGQVALRASQQVDGVPVVDGVITLSVARGDGEPRLTAVRGRLFPDLAIEPEPDLPVGRAREIAVSAEAARLLDPDPLSSDQDEDDTEPSRPQVQGEPQLVVFPTDDGGALAWQIVVTSFDDRGAQASTYYVNAHTGDVVAVRPAAFDRSRVGAGEVLGAAAVAAQAVQGEPVTVSGQGPIGEALQVNAVRRPDGTIALVDTTLPWYDPATGQGALETHDAAGQEQIGGIVTAGSTEIQDAEALAAHAMHRYILDYYRVVFGRTSWDGAGGTLTGTVRFPVECNAFFSSSITPPLMAYGTPCMANHTNVDMDTAAHEVTHGLTDTTAGLLYQGQSGALNESFSDYLGNVIGDTWYQQASTALFEWGCARVSQPGPGCEPLPDGSLGIRYFDLDVTFADYLYLLNPPTYLKWVHDVTQDHGGVHLNSAIWNGALWSVRTRLAQMDGGDALTSVRARELDQVVYRALTQYLTPAATMVDARTALEEAARARGSDAVVLDVIREVMDHRGICAGCDAPTVTAGQALTRTQAEEHLPTPTGAGVGWLDYGRSEVAGDLVSWVPGQSPTIVAERVSAVANVGSWLLALVYDDASARAGNVAVLSSDGTRSDVQQFADAFPYVAGSDDIGAWITDALYAIDSVGNTYSMGQTPAEMQGQIQALGAGGGSVVLGTDEGEVGVWQPATGAPMRYVGSVGSPIYAIDVHGEAVAVITARGAFVFPALDGSEPFVLSERASVFGVSVSERYVVWAEEVGTLGGRVASIFDYPAADTDLYLYSRVTGQVYRLLEQRGQQGFPATSGGQLTWVDAGAGGNDVFLSPLPDGL